MKFEHCNNGLLGQCESQAYIVFITKLLHFYINSFYYCPCGLFVSWTILAFFTWRGQPAVAWKEWPKVHMWRQQNILGSQSNISVHSVETRSTQLKSIT